MTDEQINIAIAEACRWELQEKMFTDYNPPQKGFSWYHPDKGRMQGLSGKFGNGWHAKEPSYVLPNYCNDLNAMHEAEKALVYKPESVIGRSTRSEYENHIATICGDFRWGVSATARQRAEAFLRTFGKWEES